jgi:hypothetical protein
VYKSCAHTFYYSFAFVLTKLLPQPSNDDNSTITFSAVKPTNFKSNAARIFRVLGRQSFKAGYWGIFLSFQVLKSTPLFLDDGALLRYSIAVPNELMPYRADSDPLYQSRLPRPQSNVPLWPRQGIEQVPSQFRR